MGDRSPKANQKQKSQQDSKKNAANAKKQEAMSAKQVTGNKKK